MSSSPPLGSGRTLAQLVSGPGAEDFQLLARALAATGLDAALADRSADLTLLAPTDAAFVRLAQSLGFAGTDEDGAFDAIVAGLTALAPGGDPIPLLTEILRYHVLGESLTRGEIVSARALEPISGVPLEAFGRQLIDQDPDAPNPRLIGDDVPAANGTLQAIDRVLLPIDVPGNAQVPPPPSIAATVVAVSGPSGFDTNGGDFDILREALSLTGLTAAVADPAASLTVFAPTDAAFIDLARLFGFTGDGEQAALNAISATLADLAPNGDPLPLLTDILLYHVVDGRFSRAAADAAPSLTTLQGGTIEVDRADIVDADPDVRDPRFVVGATDILAANGAIQAIDHVLLPLDLETVDDGVGGTIADLLARSGSGFDANGADFDILNVALDVAGLTGALDAAPDLTLFAPSDAAFVDLARKLGFNGSDEAGALNVIVGALTALSPNGDPVPLLTRILATHVVGESLTVAELRDSTAITTLSGFVLDPFGRALGDGDPTLRDARIIPDRTDLQAANGVIQAIDGVILPDDIAEARGTLPPLHTLTEIVEGSGRGFDRNGGDFDILRATLTATGLSADLDAAGADVTLLAPTDDAFVALARELGLQDRPGRGEATAARFILERLDELTGGQGLSLLRDILEYHVVDGTFSRGQLRAAGEAPTLFGQDLLFRGNEIVDGEPDTTALFLPEGGDIWAANGVFQAIGGVLLPTDLALV